MHLSEKQLEEVLKGNPHLQLVEDYRRPPLQPVEAQPSRQRESKFGAKVTEVDGIKFPSKKEAARWEYLNHMQQVGKIEDLERQPRYILQESFRDRTGVLHRQIAYTADFRYKEDGALVVEEVKGGKATQTTDFVIRKKLFLFRYPEVDYRIV